jgi:hypothetical protein
MTGFLEFDFWQGMGIFLFTATSRIALGPAQPPVQWVPGALLLGVKWLDCEADHSPPFSAEVKKLSFTRDFTVLMHCQVPE